MFFSDKHTGFQSTHAYFITCNHTCAGHILEPCVEEEIRMEIQQRGCSVPMVTFFCLALAFFTPNPDSRQEENGNSHIVAILQLILDIVICSTPLAAGCD